VAAVVPRPAKAQAAAGDKAARSAAANDSSPRSGLPVSKACFQSLFPKPAPCGCAARGREQPQAAANAQAIEAEFASEAKQIVAKSAVFAGGKNAPKIP
jgi:hypothetical protein